MAGILQFPRLAASAPPLAQFVRIGLAHLKLGDLLAEGRLPAKRVVFEASRVWKQKGGIDRVSCRGGETGGEVEEGEGDVLSRLQREVGNGEGG